MKGRKLVESLLAVTGIWMFARDAPNFVAMAFQALFVQVPQPLGIAAFRIQILHLLANAATGAALVFARKPLARWVHPGELPAEPEAEPIVATGTAILGVYFLVVGLRGLSPFLVDDPGIDADPYAFWNAAIGLLPGICLFVSTRWIIRVCHSQLGGKRGGA